MSYPINEINDVLDFYARDHGKPLARAAAHYRLRRAIQRTIEEYALELQSNDLAALPERGSSSADLAKQTVRATTLRNVLELFR